MTHGQDDARNNPDRAYASGQPGIPAGGRYRVEGRSPGSRVRRVRSGLPGKLPHQ